MDTGKASKPVLFLIDTGASITSISPTIAQRMGLRSLGKTPVSVPTGQGHLNTYLVDLLVIFGDPETALPSDRIPTFPTQNLQVMDYLGSPEHYFGLLGRDILNQGTLKVMGPERRYALTLPEAHPSQAITVQKTSPKTGVI